MTNKCIADESITEIRRGTLISLVTECAEGLGYSVQRIYETAEERPISVRFMLRNPSQADIDHNRHLRTHLNLFATNKREMESTGLGTMVGLGAIVVTPIPPNMRVQIWCESDWQGIGFDPGFSPCEVGAAIMRFLLRMVEGVERAEAWRAPWERQEVSVNAMQQVDMTLDTLMAMWPGVPSDILEDRLKIWQLWDEERLLLKTIVSPMNPSESTIKRHLDAIEKVGLLKRKRKKMNSR